MNSNIFPGLRRSALAALRGAAMTCLLLAGLPAGAASLLPDIGSLSDIDYRLGDGLSLPGTGLSLGGYATGVYERLRNQPARTAVDNVSLSIWWEGEGRWKVFAEFDSRNPVGQRPHGGADSSRYVALERMYVDYALSETTSIRAGKFLTPVGRWNLIHAAPLVWTTSRPLSTSGVFPTNATGLMLNGRLPTADHDAEYSVYLSTGNELRANPALDPFRKALGAHLNLPLLPEVQLGLSYATFEQKNSPGEHKQLVGLDFMWTRDRYELSGEGVYRLSGKGSAWDERGAFVQAVVPLSEKLYGVARIETFRTAQRPFATQQQVVGLNWRITPAIVLKAEWVGVKNNPGGVPEGFMSSVSVQF